MGRDGPEHLVGNCENGRRGVPGARRFRIAGGCPAPVGVLAIDQGQGDQWGWAVDYEAAAAPLGSALSESGEFPRTGGMSLKGFSGSPAAPYGEYHEIFTNSVHSRAQHSLQVC